MRLLVFLFVCLGLISCTKSVDSTKVGESLSGFKLLKKESVKEHNSDLLLFEHEKTGAKVVAMLNDDKNRVFQIAFNTYPEDSTGVAHILEHAVLAGSKNFPSKNTFNELKKGSFTTYLNAFTSADLTAYPVATTNVKELKNLMHVYLDAVFYPNIYNDPMVLKQEGRRIVYNEKTDSLSYNGVVYNEMKGVLGKSDTVMHTMIKRTFLPNSIYTHISGGDPKVIPSITQEQTEAFHKKFYHPSNSYSLIYGDVDIAERLKFIDDNYFSNFERKTIKKKNFGIKTIEKPVKKIGYYGIPESSKNTDGKHFLSLVFVTGENGNSTDDLGLRILSSLIARRSSSPLTKALHEAKVGPDAYTYFSSYLPWKMFNINIDKVDANKDANFKKVVFAELEKLSKDGFDKDLVEGTIKSFEFGFRENDTGYTPKGIVHSRRIMQAFKFDMDPIEFLKQEKELEEIKKKMHSGYFEGLIKKYLLNNQRYALIELVPQKGLAKKEERETKEKLLAIKNNLKKSALETIKKDSLAFKKYQATPADPKKVAKIPFLKVSDIESKQEAIPQEKLKIADVDVLYHPLFTKGISYVNLYFNMKTLPEELLPYANVILYLLENIRTEKQTVVELQNGKSLHTGFAFNSISVYGDYKNKDAVHPMFQYRVGTLSENIDKTLEFVLDIILHSKYDDYNSIKREFRSIQAHKEQSFYRNASSLAVAGLKANTTIGGVYNDRISGVSFYKLMRELNKDFDAKKEEIAKNLKQTAKILFNKNNLLIAVTADKAELEKTTKGLEKFLAKLPSEKLEVPKNPGLVPQFKKEALIVPGKVQYVAMGGQILPKDQPLNGDVEVLMNILEDEFLHKEIREKSGAYGAYSFSALSGFVTMMSYRDPNLAKTINVFKETPKFLENLNISQDLLNKYIIGTIKGFDTPKSNKQKGNAMANRYILNYTTEDRQRLRTEVINTSVDKLKSYSKNFETMIKKDQYSVAGTAEKITKKKDIFDLITNILE